MIKWPGHLSWASNELGLNHINMIIIFNLGRERDQLGF